MLQVTQLIGFSFNDATRVYSQDFTGVTSNPATLPAGWSVNVIATNLSNNNIRVENTGTVGYAEITFTIPAEYSGFASGEWRADVTTTEGAGQTGTFAAGTTSLQWVSEVENGTASVTLDNVIITFYYS